MSDTKTAVGVCQEVSERGEWTTFAIDVGTQYPVKLSTKLQPLIELGRAASREQSRMAWTYTEQESEKINEHTGKPYVNRYLSKVEVPENAPAATASSSAPSAEGMTPEKWDAKERRDYRSRAWAQTLGAFQHTIKVEEDPAAVFERLQPFQRKIFVDVCQSFAYPADQEDVPF